MSFGKAVKNILGSVAPTLAKAVGGPFTGLAMSVLEGIFPGDSEAEIEKKIAEGSPETLLALKKANQEFEVRCRELGIKEEALYIEDTKHARDFSAQTSIVPQLVLTFLFIGIYGGLMYVFFTVDFELDEWQKGQLGILIGVITTAVVQIINFWFGTSKGSKDKTAAMANGKNN